MTPPRDPPRPLPREEHPTPDNLRPLRTPTIVDVAAKVDALARDQRQHEVSEKDHRDLLGRQHVEIAALREIALEHTERLDRVEAAILAELSPLTKTTTAMKSEVARLASATQRQETHYRGLIAAVGQPPRDPQMVARESHRDMTREEIEALETGSGLRGDVARLEIHVAQLWRRGKWAVGAVGVATAVSPHIPAILNAIFGG